MENGKGWEIIRTKLKNKIPIITLFDLPNPSNLVLRIELQRKWWLLVTRVGMGGWGEGRLLPFCSCGLEEDE